VSTHTSSKDVAPAGDAGFEPFVPRRGLRGAHRQTLAAYFLPRELRLPPPECRLVRVEDNVQIRCDCHWQPRRADVPTVVVVHGLEGSSESQYVLGTANKAWDAGMNVVRMNVRNCGGTERLGPTLYHSGLSADVGVLVEELVERDGLPSIFLAGFSMGGNLVLKLAGEWGPAVPAQVHAVAAVCPGMDLAVSAAALHLRSNRLYEWQFLYSLWRSVRRKRHLFPDRYQEPSLRCLRSLRDFDDEITAPYCGFASADDYYSRASASPWVGRINVPTLVIHADDDPFVRLLPETRAALRANPRIRFIETENGGHCGFLADPVGYDGRWAERQIVCFFQECSERTRKR